MSETLTPTTPAALSNALRSRPRSKRRINWGRIAAWAVMGLLLIITLFPFFWMIRTALSSNPDLVAGKESLIPPGASIVNFKRALGLATQHEITAATGAQTGTTINFFAALKNSVIVCTLITVGQVLFCSMAAYAFARLRFPGRNKLFFLFLMAMMIPPVFTLIPNFVLVKNLGLLNTYLGIAAPFLLMTPFAVFFLRQFFLGISKEVEEAAVLDGASRWRIFRQLIIPMSMAPLTTLAVLTYITAWNEYMWPLVAGSQPNVQVLTVALNAFKSSTPTAIPDWSGLMAATFLAAIPIILLFIALGRRMVDSIGFSGIK
ncbi:MAG: carbohydrate ABC transporter permease [Solirubrobacterales bacterium]|nr:carbohydrate ABC transporter permease [Solirubrobacterales bacterium]